MNLRDLLALYGIVGIACAIAVLRRSPRRASSMFSAFMTVPLWPIWAPFALASTTPLQRRTSVKDVRLERVEKALDEAVSAAAGTSMSDIFSPKVAAEMAEQISRVTARLAELGAIGELRHFDREASARRLSDLEKTGASDRALQTARLHHEGIERLAELRRADAQALEELADLLEALRTQLVLARYAGSSAEGATAILSDVFARLEGLGTVLDPSLMTTPRYSSLDP